ncbi:MAG TPA: cache domain-containing protein [Spirochaetota bacterium]|nr:cache domain-containing protein [Spirochaetota bacterium]HPS86617.1 cache domain-containing protein [Spirochaetota bacterium]
MKKKVLTGIGFIFLSAVLFSFPRYNPEIHSEITKDQLRGFVEECKAFAEIYGKKEALLEIKKKNGLFQRGELYIYAYDFNCVVLSHGLNTGLIGSDLSNLKDPTGKRIISEMVNILKTKQNGWLKFHWFHPQSGEVKPKLGYFTKVDNTWWIGSGIYADTIDQLNDMN